MNSCSENFACGVVTTILVGILVYLLFLVLRAVYQSWKERLVEQVHIEQGLQANRYSALSKPAKEDDLSRVKNDLDSKLNALIDHLGLEHQRDWPGIHYFTKTKKEK